MNGTFPGAGSEGEVGEGGYEELGVIERTERSIRVRRSEGEGKESFDGTTPYDHIVLITPTSNVIKRIWLGSIGISNRERCTCNVGSIYFLLFWRNNFSFISNCYHNVFAS